jgi:hypothetical protein
MKKRFIAAVMSLLLFSLVACGEAETANATASETKAETSKATTTAATAAKIEEIDCFEGVVVSWSGVHPNGRTEINTDDCNIEIRKNVTFSADLFDDVHNGDPIIITAKYKNTDTGVEYTQTKEYTAEVALYDRDDLESSLQTCNLNAKLVFQNTSTFTTKVIIANSWDNSYAGYYSGTLVVDEKPQSLPTIPQGGYDTKEAFAETLNEALKYYMGNANGGEYIIKIDSEGNPELAYWAQNNETIAVGVFPGENSLSIDEMIEKEYVISDYIE